jgi:hypothetical protein
MVFAGIIRLIGARLKAGGLASTIGYVAIPFVAWWRGQPQAYVLAAVAINVLIFIRRLEGISDDVALGVPVTRAATRRLVLDASAHTDERSLSASAAPESRGRGWEGGREASPPK